MCSVQSANTSDVDSKLATKWQNIICRLPGLASKSQLTHQHSAVVIKSGKPVAYGVNQLSGGKTYHAEHSALIRYLAGYNVRCQKQSLQE